MRVIVLGGDGFCGWPTSLHLSQIGHEIIIVDNLSRRKIDVELGTESLTPIQPIEKRLQIWEELTGKKINFCNITIGKDYYNLKKLFCDFKPDAIIHFAEQRAAPYSMKSSQHKRYTVDNNLNATNDVLCAMVESKCGAHLVHLGTMGVYGYGTAGMDIPEGYLDIKVEHGSTRSNQSILYPTNPGSIYHLTKSMDQLLFQFFSKNDKLRITDLHQGIVWGTQTQTTMLAEGLINRFDYDGDYGTVLNRFLMQSAVGHPLTVHGTGGQTRAFIHISDTCKCIELALQNTPVSGERVKILNQMAETHKVRDLAKIISEISGAVITNMENPRLEASENELHVSNKTFIDLGLQPIKLEQGLLREISDITQKYAYRYDKEKILCKSKWVQ